MAISTLTAGEMLWHAAAIDPNVIAAADFSRAAELGDPIAFALHAQNFVIPGADYALRGYVAERLVMDRLVQQGHHVELPASSNMPGLDLIVDGSPVQVKAGTQINLLDQHFAKYPDIPVITNTALVEVAQRLGRPWADLVTTVPGFDLDVLEAGIVDALGHAADLADPAILEFALTLGLLRGGIVVWRGALPIDDLPAWLVIDGATRGVLGLVWRGTGKHAAPADLAIEPAAAAIGLGQHVTLSGDEGLTQDSTGAFEEATILPDITQVGCRLL